MHSFLGHRNIQCTSTSLKITQKKKKESYNNEKYMKLLFLEKPIFISWRLLEEVANSLTLRSYSSSPGLVFVFLAQFFSQLPYLMSQLDSSQWLSTYEICELFTRWNTCSGVIYVPLLPTHHLPTPSGQQVVHLVEPSPHPVCPCWHL